MALAVHDERLTRRVGLVVLAVTAVIVIYVVFIRDRLQREGVIMRVHFGFIVGLPEGSPVRIVGRQIGEVRQIRIARGGGVDVEIVVDHAWANRIPINADFFVDARSPLAPRYIAIGPPPGHAPPGRPIVTGDRVTGIDPPNLDRVLQRTWDNLEEVRRFLEAVRPAGAKIGAAARRLAVTIGAVDTHPGAQAEMQVAVRAAAAQTLQLLDDLERGQLDPAALAELAGRVDALAAKVEVLVDDLRAQVAVVRAAFERASVGGALEAGLRTRLAHILGAADAALVQAKTLSSQLRGVIADATSGAGALAAFAADLELVDEVRELTKSMKRQPWKIMPPPSP